MRIFGLVCFVLFSLFVRDRMTFSVGRLREMT